jgi:rhodanese-related sulfurtransferase
MSTTTGVNRITVDEVKARMAKGERPYFLDTRNPVAWGETQIKIKGAVRIHFEELEKRLNEVPKDRPVVTYCT